jgi:hypothetical protein
MTDPKIVVEGLDELYALDDWYDTQPNRFSGVTVVTFDTNSGAHVTVVDDDELKEEGTAS